jgi:hypothetical protein
MVSGGGLEMGVLLVTATRFVPGHAHNVPGLERVREVGWLSSPCWSL